MIHFTQNPTIATMDHIHMSIPGVHLFNSKFPNFIIRVLCACSMPVEGYLQYDASDMTVSVLSMSCAAHSSSWAPRRARSTIVAHCGIVREPSFDNNRTIDVFGSVRNPGSSPSLDFWEHDLVTMIDGDYLPHGVSFFFFSNSTRLPRGRASRYRVYTV